MTTEAPRGGDVPVHRHRRFHLSLGVRPGEMRAAWRRTTRCCGRRSRPTVASCSSTRATAPVRRSLHWDGGGRCAVDAQRALEQLVRMGIATGEAELRAGDYFGAVLNRAARVMAAGHGGQVLLDGVTAGLPVGWNCSTSDRGRLRDIAHPVQAFQAQAEWLAGSVPATACPGYASGESAPGGHQSDRA